jgi:HNH endonuclease
MSSATNCNASPGALELAVDTTENEKQVRWKDIERVNDTVRKAADFLHDAEYELINVMAGCFRCSTSRLQRVKAAELHFQVAVAKRDALAQYYQIQHAQVISKTTPSPSNPWDFRPDNLREMAAKHYGFCEKREDGAVIAKFYLTGIQGGRESVTAAHLLPRTSPTIQLEELDVHDIDDMRNILLLCKNIKKAFDELKHCFIFYDDTPEYWTIKLKIWHENTKHKLLYDETNETPKCSATIGSFDRELMTFAKDKSPYNKVLSKHAQDSYCMHESTNGPMKKRKCLSYMTRPSKTSTFPSTEWCL